MQSATKAYLQTQIGTTSQADILIMLYDGAIKFLNQAKDRMAARDMAGKGLLIGKASDVINELQSSLNKDKGGEIAENLSQLYFYCNTRLLQANMKLDPDLVDQVIEILMGLRSAYQQIKDANPQAASSQQKPAPTSLGAAAKLAANRQHAAETSAAPAGGSAEKAEQPAEPKDLRAEAKTDPPAESRKDSGEIYKRAAGARDAEQQDKPAPAKKPANFLQRKAANAYFNTPGA